MKEKRKHTNDDPPMIRMEGCVAYIDGEPVASPETFRGLLSLPEVMSEIRQKGFAIRFCPPEILIITSVSHPPFVSPPQLTDRVCDALQRIGVEACVSQRDEHGVIEIAEGPISRVIVTGYTSAQYMVNDSREWPGDKHEYFTIYSVRMRSVPFIGRVRRVRWESLLQGTSREEEFGSAVADRLMRDALITEALILDKSDIVILRAIDRGSKSANGVISYYNGWTIADGRSGSHRDTARWEQNGFRSMWNCYRTIAQHLLTTPLHPRQ